MPRGNYPDKTATRVITYVTGKDPRVCEPKKLDRFKSILRLAELEPATVDLRDWLTISPKEKSSVEAEWPNDLAMTSRCIFS
jgi:hypothetical protein